MAMGAYVVNRGYVWQRGGPEACMVKGGMSGRRDGQ